MATEFHVWLREILASAAGHVLVTKAGEAKPNPKVSEEQRARLFLDLQELPEEAASVLWRRHRDAIARLRENHFVAALTRIPSDRRKEALTKLSQMKDLEFEQALTFLNPESGKVDEGGKRLAKKMQAHTEDVKDDLDALDAKLAGELRKL